MGKVLRAEKAIENTPKNYTKKKSYFEGPGTSFLEPFGRSIRPQNQKKSNTNFSIEFETPTVQKTPAGGAGFRPWDGLRATGFIYIYIYTYFSFRQIAPPVSPSGCLPKQKARELLVVWSDTSKYLRAKYALERAKRSV